MPIVAAAPSFFDQLLATAQATALKAGADRLATMLAPKPTPLPTMAYTAPSAPLAVAAIAPVIRSQPAVAAPSQNTMMLVGGGVAIAALVLFVVLK